MTYSDILFSGHTTSRNAPKESTIAIPVNKYTKFHIPLDNKNGFLATGKFDDYPYFLVVIDLDSNHKDKDDVVNLDVLNEFPRTFSVVSGRGGIHLYYWLVDGEFGSPIHDAKLMTEFSKKFNISGVDVRGKGSKIFAPGSKFNGQNHAYTIIDPRDDIAKLSVKDFQLFLDVFVDKKIVVKKPKKKKKTTDFSKMRDGFIDCMTGDFTILHGNHPDTKIEEFLYWKSLWREILRCDVDMDVALRTLQKNQPNFEMDTTIKQLEYLDTDKWKRPRTSFYNKLFPKHNVNIEIISLAGKKSKMFDDVYFASTTTDKAMKPLQYFKKYFMDTPELYEEPILYILENETWYQYDSNKRYFILYEELEIATVVERWFQDNTYVVKELTERNLNNCISALKRMTKTKLKSIMDNIVVYKNCYHDRKKQELVMFDVMDDKILYTILHEERTYISGLTSNDLPKEVAALWNVFVKGSGDVSEKEMKYFPQVPNDILFEEDKVLWVQYMINLIHGFNDDRMMVVLIGYANAGKTPNILFIKNMLPNLCAEVPLNRVGERGVLYKKWEKNIWISSEMGMEKSKEKTITTIKSNFSDSGIMHVDLKYKNLFDIPGGKFFVGATNQAFGMDWQYTSQGIYKRICPLICPNYYNRNEEFDKVLSDKHTLDVVFSLLMDKPVKKIFGEIEMHEVESRNQIIWDWSAYTISSLVKEMYEYDDSYSGINTFAEDGNRPQYKSNCVDIIRRVKAKLVFYGITVPHTIKKRITDTLKYMGCGVQTNNKTNVTTIYNAKPINLD